MFFVKIIFFFFFVKYHIWKLWRDLEVYFVVALTLCDEINFQWLSTMSDERPFEKFAAVCDKAFFRALLTAMINMREWQSRSSHKCDESAIGFSVCRRKKGAFEEPVLLSSARIHVIMWKLLEEISKIFLWL